MISGDECNESGVSVTTCVTTDLIPSSPSNNESLSKHHIRVVSRLFALNTS